MVTIPGAEQALKTQQLLYKTLETLYPLFEKWLKVKHGYAMESDLVIDGLYLIQKWYEFWVWAKYAE